MKRGNKRGQITIFVIIAIVVIVAGIFIYMFYPGLRPDFGQEIKNPPSYMQSCLEDELYDVVETLSSQGGSVEPENYYLFKGKTVGYLCYTNEYFKTCTVQVPFIEEHVEAEIKSAIKDDVSACLSSMEQAYREEGYTVSLQPGNFEVDLEPNAILIDLDSELNLQKQGSEKYDSIRVSVNNNLYELVNIAQSILDWETNVGDAETTIYMNYYHHLKVEKFKQEDGTTIYIITNRNTGEKFQFASRSLAWPPGYGVV